MEYRFDNLLGAPYRGGNLVILGHELLSCVGNRVSQASSSAACVCKAQDAVHAWLADPWCICLMPTLFMAELLSLAWQSSLSCGCSALLLASA